MGLYSWWNPAENPERDEAQAAYRRRVDAFIAEQRRPGVGFDSRTQPHQTLSNDVYVSEADAQKITREMARRSWR